MYNICKLICKYIPKPYNRQENIFNFRPFEIINNRSNRVLICAHISCMILGFRNTQYKCNRLHRQA